MWCSRAAALLVSVRAARSVFLFLSPSNPPTLHLLQMQPSLFMWGFALFLVCGLACGTQHPIRSSFQSRSRSVLVISAGQKAPTAATPWTYRQIAGRYQSTAPEEVANEVEPASVDVGHGALPPASLVQTLFDARVHLGHKPGVWNPKNSHFIKGFVF